MGIYERIKNLCKLHGISVKELEERLGFTRSSLCKIDAHVPSAERVMKIAEYFGVTQNYILTGEDTHYENSESARLAQEMLHDPMMRELFGAKKEIGEKRFEAVMQIVRAMKEKEHYRDDAGC